MISNTRCVLFRWLEWGKAWQIQNYAHPQAGNFDDLDRYDDEDPDEGFDDEDPDEGFDDEDPDEGVQPKSISHSENPPTARPP